ncbi:MAG: Lrp/AsnC ligand binding domain-containing protein [Ignisphaera sp.]|jgi:DNA-binding Lrp family transcriptional regulator|nr:Lrp/AsnC ligand binding domain-containing protein [Ignisphaera sp.]
MPKAIVLINTEVGAEEEVLNEVKNIENVKDAYMVYGIYDIVAEVEADSVEKLRKAISETLRKIPKVRSTITLIVVESLTKK